MDKITLGRVLWRSFFLQASWNYQGQQNLGYASALLPALEKLYGRDGTALTEALVRALKPFNTQPYMSGPILGSLIKLGEIGPESGFDQEKQTRYQTALTTAFAAIGDAFYWNAMLPAAAVVGMFWAVKGLIYGALVFLVLYNLAHLLIRVGGFWAGYRLGRDVARALDRLRLPTLALKLRLMTAGGLGVLAAWSVDHFMVRAGWSWLELAGAGVASGGALLAFTALLRKGLSVEVMIYGLLALFWVWTLTGNLLM